MAAAAEDADERAGGDAHGDAVEDGAPAGIDAHAGSEDFRADTRFDRPQRASGELEAVGAEDKAVADNEHFLVEALPVERGPCAAGVARSEARPTPLDRDVRARKLPEIFVEVDAVTRRRLAGLVTPDDEGLHAVQRRLAERRAAEERGRELHVERRAPMAALQQVALLQRPRAHQRLAVDKNIRRARRHLRPPDAVGPEIQPHEHRAAGDRFRRHRFAHQRVLAAEVEKRRAPLDWSVPGIALGLAVQPDAHDIISLPAAPRR